MDPSNPTPDPAHPVGDGGGLSAPKTTTDVRLMALALEERWILDPAVKASAVRRLSEVIQDPGRGLRAVLAATKALTGLSRINLSSVDTALRAKSVEELEDRVRAVEDRVAQHDDEKGH